MVQITKYPFLRHLRAEPNRHVLLWSSGRLVKSGRGLSFWFLPIHASVAEVPCDDRELPFLFHGRSRDFQDVTVQGVVTWRVIEPEKLAERVDFSVRSDRGTWNEDPLAQIADLVVHRAQQHAWDYLVAHDVREILADGMDAIRGLVASGLRASPALDQMGLATVAVAITQVAPTSELEKALQTPAMESIQQTADQAMFQRRALAVEKERAIAENELQNQIELATREEELIAQRGQNDQRRARDAAEADRIEAEAGAARTRLEASARAESIETVERVKVDAEGARMAIYEGLDTDVLMGLAAREFAGKLQHIEHLNLGPDMLGHMLGDLFGTGAKLLDRRGQAEG